MPLDGGGRSRSWCLPPSRSWRCSRLGYSSAVIGAALFLAAYTVAAYSDRRVTTLAAGYSVAVTALVVAVAARRPWGSAPWSPTRPSSSAPSPWAAGAHVRRENVVLLQERAQLAEQARAEEARHAVADERLRIAQELHDVLGHSLGVIALQAGVGAHVIDVDPARGQGLTRGDLPDQPLLAGRGPSDPRRPAHRHRRDRLPPAAGARRTRHPGSGADRGGTPRAHRGPRNAPPGAGSPRADGVPGHPGGADQRRQARRAGGPGPGDGALRRPAGHHPGGRRRSRGTRARSAAPGPGTASSGCASGSRCGAAPCTPDPARRAATG